MQINAPIVKPESCNETNAVVGLIKNGSLAVEHEGLKVKADESLEASRGKLGTRGESLKWSFEGRKKAVWNTFSCLSSTGMGATYLIFKFYGIVAGVVVALFPVFHWLNSRSCKSCRAFGCSDSGFVTMPIRPFNRTTKLAGKECAGVKRKFIDRLQSRELRAKLGIDWIGVLDNSAYFRIKPRFPIRVGGWADSADAAGSKLTLGYESWIGFLGPWRSSAIDHELTHCRQEHQHKVLSKLWRREYTRSEYRKLWFDAEFEALALNRLWPLSILFVTLGPVILGVVYYLVCIVMLLLR